MTNGDAAALAEAAAMRRARREERDQRVLRWLRENPGETTKACCVALGVAPGLVATLRRKLTEAQP